MTNDLLYSMISERRGMDEKTAEALQEVCSRYPYCQPARLLLAKNLAVCGKDPERQAIKEAFAYAGNRKSFSNYLNAPAKSRTKSQQDIIERFLKADPKITPIKEALTDDNIAQGSLREDDSLASETLADILAKQGKKERALSMYKKLSLMFPEKMPYFAKKMEEITKSTN